MARQFTDLKALMNANLFIFGLEFTVHYWIFKPDVTTPDVTLLLVEQTVSKKCYFLGKLMACGVIFREKDKN